MFARISTSTLIAIALYLTANSQPAMAIPRDTGAGPVPMHITPCLIAKASGNPTCEEPSVPANGSVAENVAAYVKRAWFFIDLEQLGDARREVDAALALNADDPGSLHLSARLAMTMSDYPRAQRDIAHARALAPNDLDIRATNAGALQSRVGVQETLREFDEILSKIPSHLYARLKRAELLIHSDSPLKALSDIDYLIGGDLQNTQFIAMHAEANLAAGRPAQAAKDLSDALDIDPGSYPLVVRRAPKPTSVAAMFGARLPITTLSSALSASGRNTSSKAIRCPIYAAAGRVF